MTLMEFGDNDNLEHGNIILLTKLFKVDGLVVCMMLEEVLCTNLRGKSLRLNFMLLS